LRKYLRIDSHTFVGLMLIVLAVVLRIVLISLGWPKTDSDEGTMGLLALHIAYNGAHPLVLYGQNYMGVLEAYIAAALFHLFGPSLFVLRLAVVALYALFLVNMYLLTRLLFTKNLALFSLLLLGLGASEVLFRQLEAVGGSPEVLLFGSLLLLLATWLALSSPQGQPIQKQTWKRLLAYGVFGLLVGLAIWSDPLVLPFAGMACLFLFVFCRNELQTAAVLLLLLGILIGIAPQVVYLATTPPSNSSLSLLGTGYQVNVVNTGPVIRPSFGLQIAGTVLVSLPVATGANSLCPLTSSTAWPLAQEWSPQTILCTTVHGAWGLGFIMLLLIAAIIAITGYWRLWFQATKLLASKPSWKLWFHMPVPLQSPGERQTIIRYAARLMILISAGSTLFLYALFPQAAMSPWASSRYLVGLLIAVPAVLSPLCEVPRAVKSFSIIRTGFKWAILSLVTLTFLIGFAGTFELIPSAQAQNQQQYLLIQNLQHIGATHIYTDYWTCDRIAFQSGEHIVCGVLDEQLQPGLNRYAPYSVILAHDPHPTYAFPLPSPQATAFASIVTASKEHFQRFIFDGYIVYQPVPS
jgi:hypothetical protein